MECLTKSMAESYIYCEPSEPCGPDYGVGCMPDCDPADDEWF